MTAHAHATTVVKLGGSLVGSPHLPGWIDALSRCKGRAVIVPGGGPFADTVRTAQQDLGFDDRIAHRMALLAMDQFACALSGMGGFVLAASREDMERALQQGGVPVWLPSPMVLGAPDIPWSWDVTSDSLAVWLAGRLQAARLLLVKRVEPTGGHLGAAEFAAAGIVDGAFAGFLAAGGIEAAIVGPTAHAATADAIRAGGAIGVPIGLP